MFHHLFSVLLIIVMYLLAIELDEIVLLVAGQFP